MLNYSIILIQRFQAERMGGNSMRLSTLGRYALRAMVDLAMHQDQGPVSRQEIADRQELSSNYLAQLFSKLGRAGLVASVFGPGGGYILAKSADEIRAGDVLRAVDESLAPVFCVAIDAEKACHRAKGCPTRPLWKRLGDQLTETLDSITLAELCEQPHLTDSSADG
jgi:Rrf2 family protein